LVLSNGFCKEIQLEVDPLLQSGDAHHQAPSQFHPHVLVELSMPTLSSKQGALPLGALHDISFTNSSDRAKSSCKTEVDAILQTSFLKQGITVVPHAQHDIFLSSPKIHKCTQILENLDMLKIRHIR